MKYTTINICINLLFCLVILPLIIMLVPVDKWLEHNTAFLITLIFYLYFTYFVYRKAKLPSLLMHKKYVHAAILMVILIGITVMMSHFPFPPVENNADTHLFEARKHMRIQTVWFFFLIVTGFSLSIELTYELFRQILLKQEIEAEKNKAELALYKAQINPHFLFNTLNALYGLVLTKSDKTESAFIKFSEILKYMYAYTTSETIPISKEIDYIQQYVDLQSLRLNKHTQVSFETQTDDEQILIPPMILITFIENAFKYGTSSDEDCSILICIIIKDGNLIFRTENSIMRNKKDNDSAIGIENCRKRLELLYPGRFTLSTSKIENLYKVQLTIQLR
ncbi:MULTISPECIES: sensor histidine kinase [Bacteroidales]|uniref:sensor histidine kinase n=1 Tax=Bacteroidales TaxID=171549 RepID=UPI00057580EA|nr:MULTISPECIES: histidine kinase [Bacteroidales]KHM47388.1 histidine kinase [Coprobacter secundus]